MYVINKSIKLKYDFLLFNKNPIAGADPELSLGGDTNP